MVKPYNRKWNGFKRGFSVKNRIKGRFRTFGDFRKLFKNVYKKTPRTWTGKYL